MAIQTRLEDMAIGDKIEIDYEASSGAFGQFSKIGFPSYGAALSTSSSPKNKFGFIYVGNDFKGRMILVADRNVQSSISWDVLNTAGAATKDGVQITTLGLDPTQWKTNIRLLTGGTSSTTTANSEWDKYIVSGPVGSDNTTWNWSGIYSFTSTTQTSAGADRRTIRGNSAANTIIQIPSGNTGTNIGFRPVLVAESLAQPITNKYLVQDGTEVKSYRGVLHTSERDFIKDGQEVIPFVESKTASGGTITFNADHIFFDCNGSAQSNYNLHYNSEEFIDFTNIDKILVDLSHSNNSSYNYFVLRLADSSGAYENKLLQKTSISRSTLEIDVSNYVGNYQIKMETFRAYGSGSSGISKTWLYSVKGVSVDEVFQWELVGQAPVTKAMFDSHGMDSLPLLNKDTVSLLSSGQPELLCWTDQADPTRHVTMNVGEHWAHVSDTLPAVDTFLSDGMDDLKTVPESGWNALHGDFDIVTYTNLIEGSQSVQVNATPHGQLVYAETDFSSVSDLKITAVQDDVNVLRLLASGDLGATWKAYNGSWQTVDPANVKAEGMTVDTFNALTNEEWDALGGQIRIAYYLENNAIVDAVEVTKDAVATETPTLDSIKITYDDLTIEGRLKDIEMINAINMSKLQFKANSLMNSTRYQLHDLVVDTFEDDSMITSEGGTPVTETAVQTTPAAMGNGFISRAAVKTNKKILGLEVR